MKKYIKADNSKYSKYYYWERNEHTREAAKYFGVYDKLFDLSDEIYKKVPNVTDVDLDIYNFKELNQIIILVQHNISSRDYINGASYSDIIRGVDDVARRFGLTPSGDSIEDMGSWLYFVFNADSSWRVS